jgi:hypothetical protein
MPFLISVACVALVVGLVSAQTPPGPSNCDADLATAISTACSSNGENATCTQDCEASLKAVVDSDCASSTLKSTIGTTYQACRCARVILTAAPQVAAHCTSGNECSAACVADVKALDAQAGFQDCIQLLGVSASYAKAKQCAGAGSGVAGVALSGAVTAAIAAMFL